MKKYRFLKQQLPTPPKRTIVLLTGARQTGKTTLAKNKYQQLRYINLDAPENQEIVKKIHSDNWHKDIGNAVIDEAQKEPIVFDKIKYAYDAQKINFQVILGSSQIMLLKKIRESLAGRIKIYEIWPLLMSEINIDADADAQNISKPLINDILLTKDINALLESTPSILEPAKELKLKQAEQYLLQWGGMPALLHIPEEERWKWLKDYEYTYLERDLADLAKLNDLDPFKIYQRLAAARSGHLLNYSEIARDAGLSTDTARRYLEYLKLSYQIIILPPYYKNISSQIIKTPKIYWVDIGLCRQLTNNKGSDVSGHLYETMVIGEIFKWIKTAQIDASMYFYRTQAGLELDALIETAHGFIGFEIKNKKNIASKDTKSMRTIAKALNSKWLGGIIVYQGNTIEQITDPNIWQIPSFQLFGDRTMP